MDDDGYDNALASGPAEPPRYFFGLLAHRSDGSILAHQRFPVPLTDSWTPVIEIDGRTPFIGRGQESLFGTAGTDIGFGAFGPVEPHSEIGYQFPIDRGVKDRLRRGIIARLFVQR